MDTTPKYIKMCEMSGEIQKRWGKKHGDTYYVLCTRYNETDSYIDKFSNSSYEMYKVVKRGSTDKCVWLPRQDQLQEMIGTGVFLVLEAFNQFVFHEYGPYCVKTFHSREQLWLAFVMKEKFNKVWDDKKEEWTEDNL